MKRLLPVLDIDLVVEHDGHKMGVKGSGQRIVAQFPSLRALLHFGLRGWRFRGIVPPKYELQVEYRGRRFPGDDSFTNK